MSLSSSLLTYKPFAFAEIEVHCSILNYLFFMKFDVLWRNMGFYLCCTNLMSLEDNSEII